MKKILEKSGTSLFIFSLFFTTISFEANAKKNCTKEPKEKWMKEEDFKKKVEAEGYKIKKFKIPGNCYEIYGTDKNGKSVEIYYNPVDGSVFKE